MARIFITGGTGFIGRGVVSLLQEQNECTVLTRQRIKPAGNCRYVTGEVSDREKVRSILNEFRPDTMVHLAWDVKAADFSRAEKNKSWADWSAALAEDFLNSGGRNIIASGTCFEYDWSAEGVLKESSNILPNSLYGECKVKTYNAIKEMCSRRGARFTWGRVFYPYGPREEKRKLISNVIGTLKSGNVFECRTPNNRIDYVHVADVARCFAHLSVSGSADGVYNLCTGNANRLGDMLQYLARKMGKESLLKLGGNKDGVSIIGDNTKIKKEGVVLRYEDVYTGLDTYFEDNSTI